MRARLRFLVRLPAAVSLFSLGAAAGVASALIGLRLLMSRAQLYRAEPARDELMLFGVGHPVTLESESQRFRGGTLVNIGGGFAIDLSDAALDPSGGRLIVVAAGGDTEITVPETWDVHVTEPARESAGVERTRNTSTPGSDGPRLEIEVLSGGGNTVIKQSSVDAHDHGRRAEA